MARKSSLGDDDPLTRAIAPPPDESPSDREARLAAERLALEKSKAIDEEIDKQRLAEKKAEKPVKVLLLGQSESGKSTTLKNFQLIHSAKAFRAERASWRAVVQLNVVRSIRVILEAMSQATSPYSPSSASEPSSPIEPPSRSASPTPMSPTGSLSPEHLKLKMRLSPLLRVEEALWRKLNPSSVMDYDVSPPTAMRYSEIPSLVKERSLNSAVHWKGAFGRLLKHNGRHSVDDDGADIDFSDPSDPGVILHNCAEDMMQLYKDLAIREMLKAQDLVLEDMPGFFLDDLERVTALRYIPTDDDILKARLKTIGISEHRFQLKAGNMVSNDWRVFDVGGARNLRAAWAPFFDDADAIIFLAPVSCFDQVLAEDPTVNRLEDSLILWRSIVSNPLLKKTDLILFLNKCDILKTKLNAGIKFNKYVVSYGDRPNTFDGTSIYMRKKFASIAKQHSHEPKTFYCHFTSVTDVKSTFHILSNVKDMIVRQNLQKSKMV